MMIMKQKSMTKRFFMAIILAAITTFAPSTSHAENNISLGISPFGFSKIEWYPAGEHNVYYKVDYNKSWNGNVTYEFMKNGFGFMTEFSYGQAKLDKLELIQWADIDHYEPGQSLLKEKDFDKDLKMYGGALYLGINFFSGHRLQLPIYLGGAYDYYKCKPYEIGFLSFAAKARLRFYLVNAFSIYVGGTYKLGTCLDQKGKSFLYQNEYYYGYDVESKSQKSKKDEFSADAGLIFTF